MNKVCHRILYLDPDKDAKFFKDFDQILNHRKNTDGKPQKVKKKQEKKVQKTIAFSFKDKYELEHIEEKILFAEENIKKFSDKIQQPEIINDTKQMSKYCSLLEQAQGEAHTLYERWEYLEKIKEQAES